MLTKSEKRQKLEEALNWLQENPELWARGEEMSNDCTYDQTTGKRCMLVQMFDPNGSRDVEDIQVTALEAKFTIDEVDAIVTINDVPSSLQAKVEEFKRFIEGL